MGMQTWQHLVLATPWRRLFLAAFGLSLVVAVLRGSVGTYYSYSRCPAWQIVEDEWAFCLNCNKRRCYVMLCYLQTDNCRCSKRPPLAAIGSQALCEVRHQLVDVLMWQLFAALPRWSASARWLSTHQSLRWSLWYFSSMTPQTW